MKFWMRWLWQRFCDHKWVTIIQREFELEGTTYAEEVWKECKFCNKKTRSAKAVLAKIKGGSDIH